MWIGGIFLIIVQLSVSSFFVNQSGQFNPVRSDFLIKIIILFVAFSFLFNNQAHMLLSYATLRLGIYLSSNGKNLSAGI